MANPIDIANELNKLILQQNQNLLNQAKIQRNQLTMMQKMVDMLRDINPSSLAQGYKDLQDSIAGVDEQLDSLGTSTQEAMQKSVQETTRAMDSTNQYSESLQKAEKFSLKLVKAALSFGSIGKTLTFIGNAAGGMLSVLTSVGSSIINIGASIIAAPFKMLGGLMEAAAQGGGSELRQALEDVRKQFGDLATGSSKAIITMSKSMKGELANTGLSTYRIFGTLAERLQAISEYAKQLGPLFTNLSGDLMKNAEAFGAYAKGLGLSEEGMRGIGMAALTTGKSFTEVGREVTSFAFQMGDAFGINGKEISRDVATMMKDVKNFGSLSVKQLTQVTVYARKLGLDFKDMQGVIDKFDNFEDAAQGAAQLSQAFGLNIDALELVQEQDPAARFDKLRKAFYSTGKSVESMTRQELKLLAAQTGLSEEAVKLGFSQQNQGIGYDEVQKKAGLAEKKQLTQAEAMDKLANSIERMVKSGGQGFTSFFDAFTSGFQTGIVRSKEFREMMRAISQSMRVVFRAGRELGQAFVDAFPGIKDFFGGIKDLFNPEKIGQLMSGVVGVFKDFFKAISAGDPEASKRLFSGLTDKFTEFFGGQGEAGTKIMNGIKKLGTVLVNALTELVPMAMRGLTVIFRKITEFITNPQSLLNSAGSAATAGGGELQTLLQPLFDAVANAWPELKEAGLKLLDLAWEKIKPIAKNALKKIALFMFSSAATSAALSAVTSGMISLAGKLVSGIAKAALNPANAAKSEGFLAKVIPKLLGAAAGPVAIVAAFATVGMAVNSGMKKFEKDLSKTFGASESKIAAGTTGLIDMLTLGLIPDDMLEQLSVTLAEGVTIIFKAIEDYFGPAFSNSLKEFFGSAFDVLGSFGEIFSQLFAGNEVGVGDALADFVVKTLVLVGQSFMLLIEGIPSLAAKIGEWAMKIVGIVFGAIGRMFYKLGEKTEDIPIVGTLFKIIGFIFDLIGKIAKMAAEGFKGIFDLFKMDGVIGTVSNVFSFISDGISALWNMIKEAFSTLGDILLFPFKLWLKITTGIFGAVKDAFSNVKTVVVDVMSSIWNSISSIFSLSNIQKVFGAVVEGISNALGELTKLPVFSEVISLAKNVFGIRSPSRVFEGIGTNIVEGMNTGLSDMPDIMARNMSETQKAAASGAASISQNIQASVTPSNVPGTSITADGMNPTLRQSEAVQKKLEVITKNYESITSNIEALGAGVGEKTGSVLAAVVERLNTINRDLISIAEAPANLNVQLQKAADNLSLRGNGALTINKPDFTVNINVEVKLQADEFETALIARNGGTKFSVKGS